jgi:hypothetical protein
MSRSTAVFGARYRHSRNAWLDPAAWRKQGHGKKMPTVASDFKAGSFGSKSFCNQQVMDFLYDIFGLKGKRL